MEDHDKLNDIDTADIDSVVLYLNVVHTWVEGEAVCTLHTIDKPWIENEVCWDFPAVGQEWDLYPHTTNDDSFDLMKGGDIGFEPIGYSDMGSIGEWQSSNITETIKEYLHSPEKNNGVMVRSGAELAPHKFHSKESEEMELRPKLVFYTNGTGIINISKDMSVNNNLSVETAGKKFRVFIRENREYSLSIYSVLGRELFSYRGIESGWVDIPMANLSGSVFIATLESDGKTSTTHFVNR